MSCSIISFNCFRFVGILPKYTILAWILLSLRSEDSLQQLIDRNGCCSSWRYSIPRTRWSSLDLVSNCCKGIRCWWFNCFILIRSALSTSCLITIVGQMLRIPLTTLLSGSSGELTAVFWLGFLGISFSIGSLAVFTNWVLIDSNSLYSFWSTSKRGKSEEKQSLTLHQESWASYYPLLVYQSIFSCKC